MQSCSRNGSPAEVNHVSKMKAQAAQILRRGEFHIIYIYIYIYDTIYNIIYRERDIDRESV